MNSKEQILWLLLKDKSNSGYRFKRQYQHGNYILDFYSKELNLAIELDDEIPHRSADIEYRRIRDNYFRSKGIKLLKIPETLLENEIHELLNKLIKQKEKK